LRVQNKLKNFYFTKKWFLFSLVWSFTIFERFKKNYPLHTICLTVNCYQR
jgi:hypothetical protein